jgi:hypothetical protein
MFVENNWIFSVEWNIHNLLSTLLKITQGRDIIKVGYQCFLQTDPYKLLGLEWMEKSESNHVWWTG